MELFYFKACAVPSVDTVRSTRTPRISAKAVSSYPRIFHDLLSEIINPGALYCLLACLFPCIPIMLLRQEARERYNIEVTTILPIKFITKCFIYITYCYREAPVAMPLPLSAAVRASLARPQWRSRRGETTTRNEESPGLL